MDSVQGPGIAGLIRHSASASTLAMPVEEWHSDGNEGIGLDKDDSL